MKKSSSICLDPGGWSLSMRYTIHGSRKVAAKLNGTVQMALFHMMASSLEIFQNSLSYLFCILSVGIVAQNLFVLHGTQSTADIHVHVSRLAPGTAPNQQMNPHTTPGSPAPPAHPVPYPCSDLNLTQLSSTTPSLGIRTPRHRARTSQLPPKSNAPISRGTAQRKPDRDLAADPSLDRYARGSPTSTPTPACGAVVSGRACAVLSVWMGWGCGFG